MKKLLILLLMATAAISCFAQNTPQDNAGILRQFKGGIYADIAQGIPDQDTVLCTLCSGTKAWIVRRPQDKLLYYYNGTRWAAVAGAGGGGGGSGTVTSVSVTTANGVSGSVANATTTPAITLTLGAITPTSVAASGTVTGSNLSGTHSGASSNTNTGDVTLQAVGSTPNDNGITISGQRINLEPASSSKPGVITIGAQNLSGDKSLSGIMSATSFVGPLTGNVTGNVTGSAATWSTGRTVGMTGDVVWTSASLNGSANVTGTSAIQTGVVTNTMLAGGIDLTTKVTGALPIANGGTAATSASAARTNLGATTVGANLFTATNPSALSYPKISGTNTVSFLTPAQVTTDLGLTIGTNTQAWDGDLDAIASLGNGFPFRSGTNSWGSRNFAGVTNRTTVTNPDGVSGNPTFDISSSYVGQSSINTLGTITTGVWNGTGIANANLATVATATFKGRTTAGTGAPEDLTVTQATALLNLFSSSLKGLVPASGGGTSNFLRADGSWATPPGGGGGSGTVTQVDAAGGAYVVAGGSITTTGEIRTRHEIVEPKSTPYDLIETDRSVVIPVSDPAAFAVGLPDPGATPLPNGWYTYVLNVGAGDATLTPSSSTINGNADLVLPTGYAALLVTDGADWFGMVMNPNTGGGGALNLSYDATNHRVDISGGGTSATLPLADDDGATEGLSSYTANDFDVDGNGNVGLDYTNANIAAKALSNLGTTNINADLLFQSSVSIGSTAKPVRNIYWAASGTYGSTSFLFAGTPTGHRTITFPDASITVARNDAAQTFTGAQTFSSTIVGSISGNAATATALTTRTLWGQNFDGTGNVTGSLTAVTDITGGASNMVLTSGTGASRTLTFRTTTSGSTATTALVIGADQSSTFSGTVALGANNLTMTGSIGATGARATKIWATDGEFTNVPTVGGTTMTSLAQTLQNKTLTNSNNVLGGVTMTLGSDASWDMYVRNASGILERVGNGTTGQFFGANTSAKPSWQTPSGGTAWDNTVLGSDAATTSTTWVDVGMTSGTLATGTYKVEIAGNYITGVGTCGAGWRITAGTATLTTVSLVYPTSTISSGLAANTASYNPSQVDFSATYTTANGSTTDVSFSGYGIVVVTGSGTIKLQQTAELSNGVTTRAGTIMRFYKIL